MDDKATKIDPRLKTKTFGLRTPTDLHDKLLFDIERLKSANTKMTKGYAAFDCAVDSWHMVDWTLHAITDDNRFEALAGRKRPGPTKDNKNLTPEASFELTQRERLPHLEPCHMLANSVKHRELRKDLMPELSSASTALLTWNRSDDKLPTLASVELFAYVRYNDEKIEAVEFFTAMADQWRVFLTEEGLFHPFPDYSEDEQTG